MALRWIAAANLLQAAVIALNSHRATVVLILLGLLPRSRWLWPGEGLERLPVHGTVTFSNGEKPCCTITFLPEKGQPGPAANTKLVGGRYQFDRSNGPAAGPQTVTVNRIVSRSTTYRLPKRSPSRQIRPNGPKPPTYRMTVSICTISPWKTNAGV